MAFHKNFPHQKPDSTFTTWIEVALDEKEEKTIENSARDTHISVYQECIDDARELLLKNGMKAFDPNILQIASSLFEKRASHVVYHKEELAKEKFDKSVTTK